MAQIEGDLSEILVDAAASLNAYVEASGYLPYVLPNPAIRGLVEYQRVNDYTFVLRAKVSDVSLVMHSTDSKPRRE